MFVYNDRGVMEDWECRHGYPSQACGVAVDSPIENLCAKVGEHMVEWYQNLPDQSHVRLGKIWYMAHDTTPGWSDNPRKPDLHRLAGL